jgi:hypothetical protein
LAVSSPLRRRGSCASKTKPELADVVEAAARDGARPPERPHQLYLLSPPGDERTITLEFSAATLSRMTEGPSATGPSLSPGVAPEACQAVTVM